MKFQTHFSSTESSSLFPSLERIPEVWPLSFIWMQTKHAAPLTESLPSPWWPWHSPAHCFTGLPPPQGATYLSSLQLFPEDLALSDLQSHLCKLSQLANTKIRLIIFSAAKDGEALYSQQKNEPHSPSNSNSHVIEKQCSWHHPSHSVDSHSGQNIALIFICKASHSKLQPLHKP